MSEGLSPERLAELERKWEADPASRAFVQLAEEYRRLGDIRRAAEVLQKGLDAHPHYLSALVALGRCRFELGDSRGAIDALGRALAQDPAQLVANKLLVEAYLASGEPDKARERLDFYRLFNDRDEEIEALEKRIAAADEDARSDIPRVPGVARREEVFELERPDSLPPLELGGAPAPAPSGVARGEPFGALHDPASAGRRIAVALAAGGVFAVEVPVEVPAAPAAPPAEAASWASEPEPEPELEPEPIGEGASPPWGVATRGDELDRDQVEEVVAEPFRPRTIGEEVERETIEEPFDEVLQAGGDVRPRPLTGRSEPEPEESAGFEIATEPEPEQEQEAPSSTLGELYLSQGHLAEAEAEFRRVLAARPEDAVASSGIVEIERRRAGLEDTATGWRERDRVEVAPQPAEPQPAPTPVGGGLTRRKVETLRSYLSRVRSRKESARVP